MKTNPKNGPTAESDPFRSPLEWPCSRRVKLLAGILATTLVLAAGPASAQTGAPVTRVEEDWKITFGDPDPQLNAPQVSMTIAATPDLSADYAVFEINHQTQPDYVAGGLQLQRFLGDTCLDFKNSSKQGVVQIAGDVVTFTMSMQVQNGALTFGVSNGNSQTWGTFGTGVNLTLSTSTGLSDLSSYDPGVSINNSRVGFAPNRVQQVVRTQVRYFSNGTLVATNSTPTVIQQYTSGTQAGQ